MPETRTTVTVDGAPLSGHDLDLVQSLSLEESLGGQHKVSITVQLVTSDTSAWTSSLDPLVAPARPFHVALTRGSETVEVEARSVSASWHIAPGGSSTITVEGMDRSVELDRRDVQRLWQDTNDAAIAETIFAEHGLAAQVDSTPSGADSDTYSPQQSATDWAFLKGLAARNGFDVHVDSVRGVVTGVFRRVDVTAAPQATIALGYGSLGGEASASVQLLAGQEVHVTRSVPGTSDVDVASDDGRGNAMGSRSLGGATLVRTHTAGSVSVLDARTTARAMAERSAFGATLSATLTSADAPLIRARRTVAVAGLGEALDGLWLVRSVRHTITPGGHSQAIGLTRNALGSSAPGGAGALAGALAAAVGVSL
ncbi:MAG TPA: contractile injection system protein, VgrG/Pvc8 family [Ornithinibacter sp.]|nr:contractile injection system protein, VgrG/Pvc8 family [Ornithinibacter sp.]